MRVRSILYSFILSAGAALALLPVASVPVAAQQKAPVVTGPAPHMADGKPDLSGLWQRPYTPDMSLDAVNMDGKPYPIENPADRNNSNGAARGRAGRQPRRLPYTAWGAEQWKNYDATKGDYTGSCLPFGLMRSMNSPDPTQYIQDKDYLAILFEQNTWFKVMPLDGRAHHDDSPSWFGDSVAHWEGDTLVVDTNNFNGKTKLDTNGHPMSDQLHVIERYQRTDLGHIHYEVTIDDPKTYTEKWKNVRTFNLRPDWHIMEYSCEENNKDFWEGRVKVPSWAK